MGWASAGAASSDPQPAGRLAAGAPCGVRRPGEPRRGKTAASGRRRRVRRGRLFRVLCRCRRQGVWLEHPPRKRLRGLHLTGASGRLGSDRALELSVAPRLAGSRPALACGNTVVAKPAAEAGLSIVRLAELAGEAGCPLGVFNVVTGGRDTGAAIAAHPGINHITFTGSVPTGIAIMKAAADNVVPVTLELCGKSPNIIFGDADLERAAASSATTLMQNSAQTCTAPTRLLLERSAHDRFVNLLAERIRTIRMGRGLDNPDMGPVVSERQMNRLLGYLDAGARDGATAVTGGGRATAPELAHGYFIEPTLLDHVARGSSLEQEEIFGPVLTVTTFESVDEAIAIANGTPYGLVTGIWTRDLTKALAAATAIRSGQVRINAYSVEGSIGLPFGGYKRSGFGREQGVEALANYTQIKNVMINFG